MSALEDRLEAVTDPDDEDVVAGVLEALLDELPGPIADAKHSKTLRANGYCLVSELREVSRADLEALGLQPGHANAVVRKLYAPVVLQQQPPLSNNPQNISAAAPRKLIRCNEFPELQANGLPAARALEAWSDQYSANLRANHVSTARQDIAEYVMSHDGVGRPENYSDGDEEDVVLYDLLVTAGPKGLPVDLTLSFPPEYRQLKQGINCLQWIYTVVLKSSDQSIAVLAK